MDVPLVNKVVHTISRSIIDRLLHDGRPNNLHQCVVSHIVPKPNSRILAATVEAERRSTITEHSASSQSIDDSVVATQPELRAKSSKKEPRSTGQSVILNFFSAQHTFHLTPKTYKGLGLAGRFHILLANDIQEVANVIDRLELFFVEEAIDLKQGLRFCLAIDELITNILSYGLVDRSDGAVSLLVEHRDGELHAEIADNGPKFDPFSVETHAPSGSLAEREVGGLGIVLVKAVMDSLEYQHDGGFNRLKIKMKLSAG